ncbi:hypothetical protein EXS74_03030 [Candidatus Woesearchaeota archaeon]|nr:hypothetical protein [Candidatus Woesearchaeota archaeon]
MKSVVISIGGSLINPEKLNTRFLKDLKKIISKQKNRKIVLVTGGGYIAREYMHPFPKAREESLIGIQCTQLHARLLSLLLKDTEEISETWKQLKKEVKKERLVICGGFKEGIGMTSDGTSAEIAKLIKADLFINMTNVAGLYTKDPRKHKDAELISYISHKAFKEMIDKHHEKPGQHFVLDQHAAKVCKEENIPVIILTGTKNLEKVLKEKTFKGTLIS